MRTGLAVVFSLGWAAALGLLAWLWVRSPISGPGAMFLTWSLPAALFFVGTWTWLRRSGVRQVPTGRAVLLVTLVPWAAVAALTWSGVGAEWALDGLILRRPVLHWSGRLLAWLPGVFGLTVGVAGLAASLEGRYRIARGETDAVRPSGRGSPGAT